MKKYYLTSIILLLYTVQFVCSNTSTAQEWRRYSYKGGGIKGIHLSNENPDDLFVLGSSYFEEYIMYSHDGGDTLYADDRFTNLRANGVHTCFTRPDSFYVSLRIGEEKIILFSPDNGITIEERPIQGYEFNNYTLSTSIANPNRLGIKVDDGYIVSENAGITWDLLHDVPYSENGLYFHPEIDSVYFLLGYESFDEGLFKSEDYGQTWVRYDSLFHNDYSLYDNLTIDMIDPDIMYANAHEPGYDGQYLGIAKSVDGGIHWELTDETFHIVGIDHDRALLIVEDNNLFASYDGGETLLPRLVEGAVLPLDGYEPYTVPTLVKTQSDNPLNLWVYRCEIFFRTEDGGLSWQMVGEGYNRRKYKKIQKNPHNDNQLLLFGFQENTWVVNKDGSDHSLLSMAKFDGYQISDVDPNTILRYSKGLVSEQNRLDLTTDGGTTWIGLDQNIPIEDANSGLLSAAMIGSNPDILFIEMGQFHGYDYYETNMYRSDDRGSTWHVIDYISNYGWFTPDTYDPNRMYVSCDGNVYRWDSTDNSYSVVHPQLDYIYEIHPLTGDIRGGTSSGSVVVSEDGESLTTVNMPTLDSVSNIRFNPLDSQGIVVSNYQDDIFYTANLGTNWTNIFTPEECDFRGGGGLVLDSHGTIFVLGADYGIWVCEEIILGINEKNELMPSIFALLPPYPNPFNSKVQIPFKVDQAGKVQFRVYDLVGREVTQFDRQIFSPGEYRIGWDTGQKNLASGTYIIQMETDRFKSSQRITLVK